MSDEADNLVLRHLGELRAHIDQRFDKLGQSLGQQEERSVKVEGHLTDLRRLVLDTRAQMATHADAEGVGRRLDVEANQVDQRIHALEAGIADLERRLGS